jgi:hypothetical protein
VYGFFGLGFKDLPNHVPIILIILALAHAHFIAPIFI